MFGLGDHVFGAGGDHVTGNALDGEESERPASMGCSASSSSESNSVDLDPLWTSVIRKASQQVAVPTP
jgi:hypothetical protein